MKRIILHYGQHRGRITLHVSIALLLAILAVRGGGGRPPGALVAPADGHSRLPLAADPRDRRILYRVATTAGGEVVERSGDGGRSWAILLTPAPASGAVGVPLPAIGLAPPSCLPARYAHVRALLPVHSAAARLFIATAGRPGYYLDRGCSSSTGGLFLLGANGRLQTLGTAGLSFAQDPVERTIRAYDVKAVVIDPLYPATIYIQTDQGTGPRSPPAGLFRSDDGGAHWQPIDDGLAPSAVIVNSAGQSVPVYGPGMLAFRPGVPGTMTFSDGTGTYVTVDSGRRWRRLGPPAPVPPTPTLLPDSSRPALRQAAAARGDPQTAIAGTDPRPQALDRGRRSGPGRYGLGRHALAAPWPPGWAWRRIEPRGAAPPSRQDAAQAWDGADHRMLVFGGADAGFQQALSDLWSYDPRARHWSLLAEGPRARFGVAAAWDPVDRLFLVFGGQYGAGSGARFLGDLWAYRPATNTWRALAAEGPAPRSRALLAWDSAANRLLVFGGQTGDAPRRVVNDLWSFTLTESGIGGYWTPLFRDNPACTLSCPQPRASTLGAWDASAGVLRLFGGVNGAGSTLSDTWSWRPSRADSGAWSLEIRDDQPPGRADSAAAYDGAHAAVVLGPGPGLGGDDLGIWADAPSAHTWRPLPVAGSPAPAPRRLAGWVWDDVDDSFLLFGGGLAAGVTGDLWQLAPGQPVPAPRPRPTAPVTAGIGEGWVVDNRGRPLLTDAHIASLARTGARYVRIDFRLANARNWSDPAILAAYDSAVDRFLAAGIRVLGLVDNEAAHGTQADWTANNRENTGGDGNNAYIALAYVRHALVPLVRHFHGRIALWELWNEPNAYQSCSGTVCTGGSFIYPSNFAALLAGAYAAIRGSAPEGLHLRDVTLIAGGLLGHSIGGALTPVNAGAMYLRDVIAIGTATGAWAMPATTHSSGFPFDAIGQHLYVDQRLLTTRADIAAYFTWLRDAAASWAAPPPTYMTEGAWSTAELPHQAQANNLDLLFRTARAMGYVPYALWFQMQDIPPANLYYGLVTAAGDQKPAWDAYRAHAVASASLRPIGRRLPGVMHEEAHRPAGSAK